MRVDADVGAAALLVLAGDGAADAGALAVGAGQLGRGAEGDQGDGQDGGELHFGWVWEGGFLKRKWTSWSAEKRAECCKDWWCCVVDDW